MNNNNKQNVNTANKCEQQQTKFKQQQTKCELQQTKTNKMLITKKTKC